MLKDYGFVTEINGKPVYRSIIDPKMEVDHEGKKLKKKIKELKKLERK